MRGEAIQKDIFADDQGETCQSQEAEWADVGI